MEEKEGGERRVRNTSNEKEEKDKLTEKGRREKRQKGRRKKEKMGKRERRVNK